MWPLVFNWFLTAQLVDPINYRLLILRNIVKQGTIIGACRQSSSQAAFSRGVQVQCVLFVLVVTVLCLCAVREGNAGEPNRSHQWLVLFWLHWRCHGELKGRTHITAAPLLFMVIFLAITCSSFHLPVIALLSLLHFVAEGCIQYSNARTIYFLSQ